MWTARKKLARAQFREFDERGPVLVELDESAHELPGLVDDYFSFGGTLRALLIPDRRAGKGVVDVRVDYASWKLTVGSLPEPLTREFYRPLRKLEREGTTAICVATIERSTPRKASSSSYDLWLNPAA